MTGDLEFNFEDLWFIRSRGADDKRPQDKWGGYNQDFSEAEHVYRHEDVKKFPHDAWAIVGVEAPPHTSWSLLVFDLDIHKAPPEFNPDRIEVTEGIPLTRTQNGGFHVPAIVRKPKSSGAEDEFHVPHDLDWDVDIRGSFVSHHVLAPNAIPGVGGSYKLVNDASIPVYASPRDFTEHVTLDDEPLVEYNPSKNGGITSFDVDRSGEPPDEMPKCYHAGLRVRETEIDNPNYDSHRVNMLTALCGAAAGYDVETMTDHFAEEYPPNGDPDLADREKSRYQVKHIIDGVENGQYSPPSIETLQKSGILDDGEDCDCDITNHGGEAATTTADKATWLWWAEGRQAGNITGESVIPTQALRHIVREHTAYKLESVPGDTDGLPWLAINMALSWLKYEWGPEELGIDPYDDDDDREVTAREYASHDVEDVYTWEAVRRIYENSKERGRYAAVNLLRQEHHFLTPEDTEELHVYNPDLGIYEKGAKYDIGRELDRNLVSYYSQHEKNEILGRLKEVTLPRDELEAARMDGTYVCVQNGVLDIDDRELLDHDPKWLFTRHLPVEYNPSADCPRIQEFLRDITRREEDWQTMLEMLANALLPHYDYESFMVLFGRGSNGKSTWFNVVRDFLGRDNIENIPLQDLADNRFAPAHLLGKWANIGGDLPEKKIDDMGDLKDLTGGGEVWAEKKGEDGFNFRNRAKMMFAANQPPVLGERSYAVARRILPIRLPHRYTSDSDDDHKDRIAGLEEELTTEEELSGLLNLTLDALERLREQDDFSLPESKKERLEYYEQFSDHIKMFAVNCLQNESGERETKSDVYNAYTAFCEEKGRDPVADQTFWRNTRKTTLDISTVRPSKRNDARERMVDNLTFTDHGQQFAPNYETPEPDADAIAAVAPGDEGVTVEGRVVERETDVPDGIAEKARLMDVSGEITVTIWDDANKPRLDEGTAYRLKNVDVQQFDGKPEISVGEVSGVVEISHGIGQAPPADSGPNAQLQDQPDTAADGGQSKTEDENKIVQLKPRVVQAVRELEEEHNGPVPHYAVLGKLAEEGEDPSDIEDAINRAMTRDGKIMEPQSDHYRPT